ncbi:MAG: OsmC family protein [Rickettsiales bacterium]|nr:OsmC family protein [Rickettsiales bacterium]
MVAITIDYQGNLRTQATHEPSGTTMLTDAPVDNHGKGESFSPTDLVATALGSCMLTLIGIYANKHNIDVSGSTARVEKSMATAPSRRVGELNVHLHIPHALSDEQKEILKKAALTCPVHHSLHPDISIPVEWEWG